MRISSVSKCKPVRICAADVCLLTTSATCLIAARASSSINPSNAVRPDNGSIWGAGFGVIRPRSFHLAQPSPALDILPVLPGYLRAARVLPPCDGLRRFFFYPAGRDMRRAPRFLQHANENVSKLFHFDPLRSKRARANEPLANVRRATGLSVCSDNSTRSPQLCSANRKSFSERP